MKDAGFVHNTPVAAKSGRLWRTLFFLLMVAALACYVISRWEDFALILSGGTAAVPATRSAAGEEKEDFLVEFKVDREKMQKEQVDMLQKVIDDKTASKEIRDAAYQQYLFIVDAMGKELKIERLLKAKGYESVAFLSPDACTVIVRASSLDEKQVSMIGDTARKVTRLPLEKINVIPAP